MAWGTSMPGVWVRSQARGLVDRVCAGQLLTLNRQYYPHGLSVIRVVFSVRMVFHHSGLSFWVSLPTHLLVSLCQSHRNRHWGQETGASQTDGGWHHCQHYAPRPQRGRCTLWHHCVYSDLITTIHQDFKEVAVPFDITVYILTSSTPSIKTSKR